MVNIENHENRFADMESGREADAVAGRGAAAAGFADMESGRIADVQGGGAAAKMAALPGAPRRSPATDFSFSIK